MKTDTPYYILFLFAVIFGLLLFIVLNWLWTKLRGSVISAEGFENPQYTYLPNTKSPNLSIQFGLSDLAIDISSVCGFIKVDSKLTSRKPTETTSPSSSSATHEPEWCMRRSY